MNINSCFGCKYFDYDQYIDDYDCYADRMIQNFKVEDCAWNVRKQAFYLYDRQKMSR